MLPEQNLPFALVRWINEKPSDSVAGALISSLWGEMSRARACIAHSRLLRMERGARRDILLAHSLVWARGCVHRRDSSAAEMTRLLLRAAPKNSDIRLLEGIREGLSGRWERAARHYRRAILLAPTSARPRLYLAEYLMRRGRWRKALALLRSSVGLCLRDMAKDDAELIDLYRVAVGAFDFALAEILGERLCRRAARDPRLNHHLCWIPLIPDFELFARPVGYSEAMNDALTEAASRSPGSPWPAFFRATLNTRYQNHSFGRLDEDCARLRRMSLRGKEWMLAPVAIREFRMGLFARAQEDRRKAERAGIGLRRKGRGTLIALVPTCS